MAYFELGSGIYEWEKFSPEHKVALTSHAIRTPAGLILFDPIWEESIKSLKPVAVFLTNANHERDARRYGVPIHGAKKTCEEMEGVLWPEKGTWAEWGLEYFDLSGGAPGECMVFDRARGVAFFGDAVVNLPGRGLEILPAKYCTDREKLRERLRIVCELRFNTAVMAHGEYIAGEAFKKIFDLT